MSLIDQIFEKRKNEKMPQPTTINECEESIKLLNEILSINQKQKKIIETQITLAEFFIERIQSIKKKLNDNN